MTFLILLLSSHVQAQVPNGELSPRDRDHLRSQSITLVKEFEQLLNILAHKGTTSTDALELVALATSDPQTRLFYDPEIVLEDDIYSVNADSLAPKDVSVRKYLNDWDLFYAKSFENTVNFNDLRLSELVQKEYLFIQVQFQAAFKGKHKEIDKSYHPTRRVATIRFDWKGGRYRGYIQGVRFFNPKRSKSGSGSSAADFKPFVKEFKIKLTNLYDTTQSEGQLAMQRKKDSLYVEALQSKMQKTDEDKKKDQKYAKAIEKGDSLLWNKEFANAIEAFTEARTLKPLETYPRTKINELTRLLSNGAMHPRQMFMKQMAEGDAYFKAREYESARQAYQSAYIILPENPDVIQKFHRTDEILKKKVEIRRKYVTGNHKAALKDYGTLLETDPNNTDFYFERARCYLSMGDKKRALVDFNTAIEQDPKFNEALEARASLLQKMGNYTEALADRESLIKLEPGLSDHLYRKGVLLAAMDEPENAEKAFNQALVINPKDYLSATGRAGVQRKTGKRELAIRSADLALSLKPEYSSAVFQKAMALYEMGEESKAAPLINRCYVLGLDVSEERELEKSFQEWTSKAEAASKAGQHEVAIQMAKKALVVHAKSVETWFFIAREEVKSKHFETAIAHLDHCISLERDFYPPQVLKGQLYLDQKEYRKAITVLTEIYQADGRQQDACLGIGDAYLGLDKYDSALVWFNLAYSIKSSSAPTLVRRGKCHFMMENYQKALLDLENAILENNRNADAYFVKARVNRALRQTYVAIDNFKEARRLGFEAYACQFEIGQTLAASGSHKQAIKSFSEAIALDSSRTEAYAMRGLSYSAGQAYPEALADFQKVIQMDSLNPNLDCLSEMGYLHIRNTALDKAGNCFSRILQFDASHIKASFGNATVAFLQGKKEIAMAGFESAFQLGKIDLETWKKEAWMKYLSADPQFQKIRDASIK